MNLLPMAVNIHIGAHKTATTHLQDSLACCYNNGGNGESKFWSREDYRLVLQKFFDHKIRDDSDLLKLLKVVYYGKTYKSASQKLIISEENLLGDTLDPLDPRPYHKPNVELINFLAKRTNVTVFLSIRDFYYVLTGCYATALRFNPKQAMYSKKQCLRRLSKNNLPSWVDVINRLKILIPNVEIKIWTQDYYRVNSEKVFYFFTGDKLSSVIIDDPVTTITPSEKAIDKVENLIKKMEIIPRNWRELCENIFKEYSVGEKKYNMFDDELKIFFDGKYLSDQQILKDDFGESFLGNPLL